MQATAPPGKGCFLVIRCQQTRRARQGSDCWSLPGALRKGSQWLWCPCCCEPGFGPLSLRGPGFLMGTAHEEQAGQDGWQGAVEEMSQGRL